MIDFVLSLFTAPVLSALGGFVAYPFAGKLLKYVLSKLSGLKARAKAKVKALVD